MRAVIESRGESQNGMGGEVGSNKVYPGGDRKSTRLNSSHSQISYAVFCLKKKNNVEAPHSRGNENGAFLQLMYGIAQLSTSGLESASHRVEDTATRQRRILGGCANLLLTA